MEAAFTIVKWGGKVCEWATGPAKDLEFHLEPFSLIVSLAMASLLPAGTKPSYYHFHITWVKPDPHEIVPGISVKTQGAKRTLFNWLGYSKATRNVIAVWQENIRKALCWYNPLYEGNEKIRGIFQLAKRGLEKVLHTYRNEVDGTPGKIRGCIYDIESCLDRGQVVEVTPMALTERIKNLWGATHIDALDFYLREAFQRQGMQDPSLGVLCQTQLDAIEGMINERCKRFDDIMKQATTY